VGELFFVHRGGKTTEKSGKTLKNLLAFFNTTKYNEGVKWGEVV
jgi:hypothetical protein